jgi:hypothetical protein
MTLNIRTNRTNEWITWHDIPADREVYKLAEAVAHAFGFVTYGSVCSLKDQYGFVADRHAPVHTQFKNESDVELVMAGASV